MIKLSKIFSREHTLFYVYMWNRSDRLGFKQCLDHDLKNSLFLKKDKYNKISLWYEGKEFNQILKKIAQRFKKDKSLLDKLAKILHKEEKTIASIFDHKKEIRNTRELEEYYKSITRWWSSMVILFEVPDLKDIPKTIRQKAFHLRRLSEKYSDKQDTVFINFWKSKYPKMKDITFLIEPSEIFGMKNSNIDKRTLERIKERINGYGLFNNRFYLLPELKKEFKKSSIILDKETPQVLDEIKGFSANKGRVIGITKIIKHRKQFKNIKKGDVLVTEMTSPDYAPIFKKIKAIITDEGGITCHAAIVSRELNIPCIVGTKIATKMLKDGDLVGVDAEKGIVKILKRKK